MRERDSPLYGCAKVLCVRGLALDQDNSLVSLGWRGLLNIVTPALNWYYCRVEYASEILDKPVEWSVWEAAKPAFVSEDPNRRSVSTGLEPT